MNSVAEASQLPVAAEIAAAASVHSLRSSSAPAILRDVSERNDTFHTGAAHHSLVAMTHSTESAIRLEGCLIRPTVKCQLAVRLWRSQFQVAKLCFVYLVLTVCVLFVSFRRVFLFFCFSLCLFFCRVLMFSFRFFVSLCFFFVFFVSWGPRQWHTGVGSCRQGLMSLIDTKHMEDSCASKSADECPGTFVPDSEGHQPGGLLRLGRDCMARAPCADVISQEDSCASVAAEGPAASCAGVTPATGTLAPR